MWSVYKCKSCNAEMNYFTSTPKKQCVTFIGKVQGYCKGELVEMYSISIEDVKKQHRRPWTHGKINATAN